MMPLRLTQLPNHTLVKTLFPPRKFSGQRGGRLLLLAVVLFTLFSLPSFAAEVLDCSEEGLFDALSDNVALFTEDCSITLTGPIPISTNTVIDAQGHNVSISGDNQFLVFEIQQGASLTISGVTITGGQNTNGGAFFVYDGSVLVLSNCTLAGNQALGTNGVDGADAPDTINGDAANGHAGTRGGTGSGGAIFNLGSVTLMNCTVTTNSASGGNGGNGGKGGNTTASLARGGNGGNGGNGGAAFGGAIYHAGNSLLISNCTFSGNSVLGGNAGTGGAFGTGFSSGLAGSGGAGAQGSGAAVYNTNGVAVTNWVVNETNFFTNTFVIFSTNDIVVVQSTFSDNSAQGGDSATGGTASTGQGVSGARGGDSFGGALFLSAGNVTNCTFYNDKVSGGAGGDGGTGTANLSHGGNGGNGGNATGAAIYHSVLPAELDVVSCTISNCSAFGGTNGVAGPGPFAGTAGTKGPSHGSVANGTGTFNLQNTILATNLSGQASFGTFVDAGYNITFGTTFKLKSGSGSFKTNNVKLGPLKNNGGLTATMALLTGSPAIDRIPPTNSFPPIDQRGFPRPMNTFADIGAFELESAGAPFITQEPTNAITTIGSNATFFVVAVGAPILKYQWFLNGITNGGNRSSFTVTNATLANGGPTNGYYVNVFNSIGSTNSSTNFIRFSPSITNQPANQTVAPGGTATFIVGANGDSPLVFQWQLQGTNLAGATQSIFTRTNVHQIDAGNYQAVVTNPFGSVTSAPAALNLQPGIIVQPSNVTAVAGSTVILYVGAEGTPPLSYQWQKNGTNVALNANSSSFIINVTPDKAGTYSVSITNAFGSTTSSNAILTVVNGSGAPPVSIATPTVLSNNLNLVFPSQTGFTYVIEFKTNLSSPAWTSLLSTNGTGNPVHIQDSTTNSSSRFYRVRVQ
jgi:Immunoglobulin domain